MKLTQWRNSLILSRSSDALSGGICSPVNKEPIETGDAYYEGLSTQPGHVGAGLVVPRPDLISQVMVGLEIYRAVLLVGPSGVGKSAALWTLPFALPGVLWFRANQISDSDVPHIVRLLQAYATSPKARVGLLVDAAGRGDLEGWSRLRRSVATIPGAFVVGTVRHEDLFTLGDLADCTTVTVSLDEKAAAAIHAGLSRRGATTVPYWREAFEQSHGLTLEFTHMLTQGRRLTDVLADQIADRVRENRHLELRILALAATADRWSASIPIGELEGTIGAGPAELRAALARLVQEHFLVEREGTVTGVHQIRSRGIVDLIHEVPPPDLKTTVLSVLPTLRGADLSRFVYGVLREVPTLQEPLQRELEHLVQDDVERLAPSLRGLELLDFHKEASAWLEIARRHDVPPADLPILFLFVIASLEFLDFFPDHLRNASSEIASLPTQRGARNALLEIIGLEGITSELAEVTNTDSCLRLLRAISRTSIDWTPLLAALQSGSPLVDVLKTCSLAAFGDCVSSAREVSLELAEALVHAVGGVDAIVERFRDNDPWLSEIEVASVDGDLVGVARFLYVSESEQGDARERAVETGRLLLRTLPNITRVDVKAMLPGGRPLEIDGVDHGASGLLRQYDPDAGAIARNQDRARIAHSLFGASETQRLAMANKLLGETARLVRDFGNAFVRPHGRSVETQELYERCNNLHARGRQIPPRLGPSAISDEGSIVMNDPLSALIVNVCGNALPRLGNPDGYAALSAYIGETILGKDIPAARDESWRLVGYEDVPTALDELSAALFDIYTVLTELRAGVGYNRRIINLARRGTSHGALARAANWSRQGTRRRAQQRRRAVKSALRSTGFKVDVFWSDGESPKGRFPNFAVAVDLDSLADWSQALTDLLPKVEEVRLPGESPLLVPLLNGRSIAPLAMRLVSNLWPVSDLGEFEHLLPQPLEQRLTTPVIAAHSALQVISGLSILRRDGGVHDQVSEFLERTVNDYKDGIATIRGFGKDVCVTALVDFLEEIVERIKGEWNGEAEVGAFAASVVEGALGDGSQGAESLQGALVLSLQWDSDPTSAVTWFESLEE